MRKRTKFISTVLGLSLSFLSVNQAVFASNDASSDKVQWLTDTLKTEEPKPSVKLQALSAKASSLGASEDYSKKTKLRPFLANRKLPTRHELEMALIEQKAKMAAEAEVNARLNGQVSTFVNNVDTTSDYTPNVSYRTLPRIQSTNTAYNQTKNVAKHISGHQAFSIMQQAEQHLLSSMKEHPAPSATSNIYPDMQAATTSPNIPANIPTNPPTTGNQFFANPNAPADLSFSVPSSSIQPELQTHSTAGPPPFPLSLLPEATLKQLVKSMAGGFSSRSNSSAPSYFGSWHNNVRAGNLPASGFQSYINSRSTNLRMYNRSCRVSALPAVTSYPHSYRSQSNKKQSSSTANKQDSAVRNRLLVESQVRVATYPAYATHSLRFWNFAQ